MLRAVKRVAAQDWFGVLDPPENVKGRLMDRKEISFDQVRTISHVMAVPAQKIYDGMGTPYEISPVPRLAENLLSEVFTVDPETKVKRTGQDFLHRLWGCQIFIIAEIMVRLSNLEDPISLNNFKNGNESIVVTLNGGRKSYYHPESFKGWYGNTWVGKPNVRTQQLIHRKNQVRHVILRQRKRAEKLKENRAKKLQMNRNAEIARALQMWYNAENHAHQAQLKKNEEQRILNELRKYLHRNKPTNNVWNRL
jgi:hypothetical protein